MKKFGIKSCKELDDEKEKFFNYVDHMQEKTEGLIGYTSYKEKRVCRRLLYHVLRKRVKNSNMLFELKQREFYTKPSTLRKRNFKEKKGN